MLSALAVYAVTCYMNSHFTFTLHYITSACHSFSGIPTCGLFDLREADELPSSAFIFIHLLKLTGSQRSVQMSVAGDSRPCFDSS